MVNTPAQAGKKPPLSPEEKAAALRQEKIRSDLRIGFFYLFFFICLFLICCYGLIAES